MGKGEGNFKEDNQDLNNWGLGRKLSCRELYPPLNHRLDLQVKINNEVPNVGHSLLAVLLVLRDVLVVLLLHYIYVVVVVVYQ